MHLALPSVFQLRYTRQLSLCNDISGCPAPALLHPSSITWEKLKTQIEWPENGLIGFLDLEVFAWTLGYHFLSLVLLLLLPGQEVEGQVLANGGRLKYKFNAWNSAMVILAGMAIGTALQGANFVVYTYIWDHFNQILTANMVIATVQAVYVYLDSFGVPRPGQENPHNRELAMGGHSGNIMYDFFIGRELNPRFNIPQSIPLIGGQVIDIKTFNEVRPGMLGWAILDMSFAARQYRQYGYITDSMILLVVFNTIYVLDALLVEEQILNQIDIVADGFGYMLAFGDLVWLPFVYSMQCRYLASYPLQLGWLGVAGVLAVQAVGLFIFRSSNSQKNLFRKNPEDPKVAHLSYITTSRGSKLLTSGWWGSARHVNYFGDIIMSLSYCLPTGVAGYVVHRYTNPVTGAVTREVGPGDARGWGMLFTYFYIIYMCVLLAHRQRRDDAKCLRKYGKDWERYVALVPSRIVPGVY